MSWRLTDAERRQVWARMRVPAFAFVALLVMLAGIILIGLVGPTRTGHYLIAGLSLCMIATVLLFSMEVRLETPLMRFYALLGFCWLAILLTVTMIDYWTR